MTYAELDVCSNRVANELRRRALKLEESVAILHPVSCEFLVAVLGVLKAGGSYFQMAVDTPARRLEFLLSDSASRLVLADEAGAEALHGWSGDVMDLTRIVRPSSAASDKNPGVPADPNRRAYVNYTSGSTGQPKGVEIEHHSLTNLIGHYHRHLKLTAQDRASMLAHVAFDASVGEVWPTLCAGGTIVIPKRGILLNPDGLIDWLASEEITLTFVATGLAEILFTRSWPKRMKLRYLITGGDRLRVRPPAGLPFTVINAYGPTENTVISTWSVVAPKNGAAQPAAPIGRPFDNTTAYVLDERLQTVPVNVVGELFLGGEQVARGYLGRPDLTSERFLADPFAGKSGARMYRTGDWVRWLPDGELEFLGRRDGQIQIRGRRVELGEIEAAMFACGRVRQVCCAPLLDEGMPSGLVAHVVPEIPGSGFVDELRAYLCARLPDYMVPSEIVLHESLPLTVQGKLDRAALAGLRALKRKTPPIVTGGDGLAKVLAQLWQSLLPAADDSPAESTFAALGGDSLLAIKMALRVEEITGLRFEVSDFLVKPTFAGLCEAVRMRLARAEFEPVLTLHKAGTRPPVFCLYGYDGDIVAYFGLVEALGADQPVFGLRSPALHDLSRLPQSMEEAAAEVVRWIRKIQPNAAPSLIGYSWAGLLAFEVARQLAETEGIHCYTALIGAPAPLRPTTLISRLAHFFRHLPLWIWNLVTDHKHLAGRLTRWRDMAVVMERHLAEAKLPVDDPDLVSSPISVHMIGLMEKYRPLTKPEISVDVFRERNEANCSPHPLRFWKTDFLPDGGWNHWTRQPSRVHWLDGDHVTILRPPLVSRLAQAIRDRPL